MSGIAELAAAMMGSAQRRMAIAASNLGNVSTPSYLARRVFSQVVDLRDAAPVDSVAIMRGAGAAALKYTGDPLDIASAGTGSLLLRDGDRFVPVNSVHLRRADDGRLVDMAGRALQAAGGGDVTIGAGAPTVLADGTMLIDGQAVSRIGLFDAGDPTVDLPEAVEDGTVRQAHLVPSGVDPATEMIELSKAGRLAETGARVFQVYDELLGQVASKLGKPAA